MSQNGKSFWSQQKQKRNCSDLTVWGILVDTTGMHIPPHEHLPYISLCSSAQIVGPWCPWWAFSIPSTSDHNDIWWDFDGAVTLSMIPGELEGPLLWRTPIQRYPFCAQCVLPSDQQHAPLVHCWAVVPSCNPCLCQMLPCAVLEHSTRVFLAGDDLVIDKVGSGSVPGLPRKVVENTTLLLRAGGWPEVDGSCLRRHGKRPATNHQDPWRIFVQYRCERSVYSHLIFC